MSENSKTAQRILDEIQKVVVGKTETVEKILMAILAGGHILMEDVPGVGKTTTAMTFAKDGFTLGSFEEMKDWLLERQRASYDQPQDYDED